MDLEESLPKHEFVARAVIARFPSATMKVVPSAASEIFEISHGEKVLLIIDKRGVKYFFFSRRKKSISWEKVTKPGLPRAVEYILRDLAEAHYEVYSPSQRLIPKRPIHISRYKRCPQCKEQASLRQIIRTPDDNQSETNEILSTNSAATLDGAEFTCESCGWMGIREEINQRSRFKTAR